MFHTFVQITTWWRHQMETFSAYWPVVQEITGHRWIPRTKASDADHWYFLRLNKQLSKQSRCRWFEMPSRSLWRHCNGNLTLIHIIHAHYLPLSFKWQTVLNICDIDVKHKQDMKPLQPFMMRLKMAWSISTIVYHQSFTCPVYMKIHRSILCLYSITNLYVPVPESKFWNHCA